MKKTTVGAAIMELQLLFSCCRLPQQIVSDTGPQFVSEAFLKVNVEHVTLYSISKVKTKNKNSCYATRYKWNILLVENLIGQRVVVRNLCQGDKWVVKLHITEKTGLLSYLMQEIKQMIVHNKSKQLKE